MPNDLSKEFEQMPEVHFVDLDDIKPGKRPQRRDVPEPTEAGQFCGRNLRLLRRGLGLSQMELSKLLGVTQPNISRWEAGFETTPAGMREKIREIMSGGTIDQGKHLARMVMSDPNITVLHLNRYSMPIVQLSRYEANMLSQAPSAYSGKDYRRVFRSEWFDEVFQNRALSDFALVNVHHDLIPDEPGPKIKAIRAHNSLTVLNPANGTPVIVAKARYSNDTGTPPRMGLAVTNDELFDR